MSPTPVTPSQPERVPQTPPPLSRPNPRKRALPSPSPIAIAFNLGDRRSASTWARDATRAEAAFGGLSRSAPPPAPLLPPAPVFEVLPLPDTPISPLGPHSSPMRRSPAIASLSQFTLEAQREAVGLGKQNDGKWIEDSISRHEIKAFRAPRVDLVADVPLSCGRALDDGDSNAPLQVFHLELTSPDLAPLRNPRPTRTVVPIFDDSAPSPDSTGSTLTGMSWSPSLPALSTSSSSSTLSSLGSRPPSPFSSPSRHDRAGLSPRCRSPAFELAKSLSIATLHSEHREVSSLALRRLEKRHREQKASEASSAPVLGLGLTLHP
ncbi:hypothetical protein JCM3774_002669 [Rhodotorula dairenensis]